MAPAAQAAMFTEYTNKAAFEAALAPGAYTETQMYDKYPNYSGGSGFSYTVGATGGRFKVGVNDLSTSGDEPSALTFSFGSGIKAFGGYFYVTNTSLNIVATPLQISLNSNSFATTKTSTSTTTFYGFISDMDLIDATITKNNSQRYVTAGTVIVGTPASALVAAPGPLPLFGAAAAFGWSRRLRRRLVAGRPGC
ncbi:MAG: hypothetical protein NTZ40_02540 [Cyanobacteria bacterium]|nr:hypothetical protein [Cyanobacteriota bacterium]